jgi:hypothetical protein
MRRPRPYPGNCDHPDTPGPDLDREAVLLEKFICRIFGHTTRQSGTVDAVMGYRNEKEYRARAYTTCDRCHEYYHIGYISVRG